MHRTPSKIITALFVVGTLLAFVIPASAARRPVGVIVIVPSGPPKPVVSF